MNLVAVTFGKNLARHRRRTGISQEELGYRASLHRTEVGLLERGARTPRIDTLIKLSSGLGIAPEQLLEGIAWSMGNLGEVTPGRFLLSADE